MSDGDRIPLEVNCVPLNAEHFAATQAVKGLDLRRDFRACGSRFRMVYSETVPQGNYKKTDGSEKTPSKEKEGGIS